MKQAIQYSAIVDGKTKTMTVGTLEGDILTRQGKQVQYFKNLDAYAMARHILNRPDFKYIRIIEDDGRVLITSKQRYLNHGKKWEYKGKDGKLVENQLYLKRIPENFKGLEE